MIDPQNIKDGVSYVAVVTVCLGAIAFIMKRGPE